MTSVHYNVPFYSNTPDDTHCAQATLRSALGYFEPHKEFTWKELDHVTSKLPGKGTWRMAGLLWLRENGYEVHDIGVVDYATFAERGLDYWTELHSPEAAAWEAKNFDIPAEQIRAQEFVKVADIERRVPTQKDITHYLDLGFLVQITVNILQLNNTPGQYRGHAILVIGYTDTAFIIHDPGLPPRPNRIIPYDLLEAAWANPGPQSKVITALRLIR